MNKNICFLAFCGLAILASCVNNAEHQYLPATVSECLNHSPVAKAESIVDTNNLYYSLVNKNVVVSFYKPIGCNDEFGILCNVKNDTARMTFQHPGVVYSTCSCRKLFTVQLPLEDSAFSVLIIDSVLYSKSSKPL